MSWGTNVPVTEGRVSGLYLELAGTDIVSDSQPMNIQEPGYHAYRDVLLKILPDQIIFP